jgi:hypothetical protein
MIAGLASGTFTESLLVGDGLTSGAVAFADVALTDIIGMSNPALIGWDMATPIGPVLDVTVLSMPGTPNFDTNVGTLVVDDAYDKSFSATISTPEPATAILLGGMLMACGAGFIGRRTSVRPDGLRASRLR